MLTPEILLIASEENAHALEIQKYIQNRHQLPVLIFDISCFPQNFACEFYITNMGNKLLLLSSEEEKSISFEKLRSVWWWAPGIPKIFDKFISKEAAVFAYTECCQFLNAMSYSLSDCLWVNQPERQEIALNPIYQIQAAKLVGFKIPETLITSHPNSLRIFLNKHHNKLNFRSLIPLGQTLGRLSKENLEKIEDLIFAPCLFQEALNLKKFISVFDIGNFLAPVEVFYEDNDDTPRMKTAKLPHEITQRILSLMKITGLLYSCIDFGIDQDNNYIFLGMDPISPFLDMQQQTKVSITEVLAELLVKGKIGGIHSVWPTLSLYTN